MSAISACSTHLWLPVSSMHFLTSLVVAACLAVLAARSALGGTCPAQPPWPLSPNGTVASVRCSAGYSGNMTRVCLSGGWLTPNTTNCVASPNYCPAVSAPLNGVLSGPCIRQVASPCVRDMLAPFACLFCFIFAARHPQMHACRSTPELRDMPPKRSFFSPPFRLHTLARARTHTRAHSLTHTLAHALALALSATVRRAHSRATWAMS